MNSFLFLTNYCFTFYPTCFSYALFLLITINYRMILSIEMYILLPQRSRQQQSSEGRLKGQHQLHQKSIKILNFF